MNEVAATKTEGKLYHLLNDGNVTDEGGLTVCNCLNIFVSKKKAVLNANHLVKCWNENESLRESNRALLEALYKAKNYIFFAKVVDKSDLRGKTFDIVSAAIEKVNNSTNL